jgi:hypothetical protein
MFDWKREKKKTFAKKKKKKHPISPFQKKPTASKVMDYVTRTPRKTPPLPNHYHLFQEIMKKERTSPNKSEFLIVKVTFVGTQNNA